MTNKLTGWVAGIEAMAFTLLEGSMVTLGLLVAPVLFKKVESRDLAGRIFGGILDRWFWVGLGCTLILLAGAILTVARVRPISRLLLARLVLAVIMTGLIVAFGLVLSRIDTIQAGLTKPIDEYPIDQNPRLEFDQLHQLSTNLLSTDLFVGLGWLVFSVLAFVKLRGATAITQNIQVEQKQGEPATL